ncbi:hypothetical protein [Herbaspirillum robiniae]|nr:hypothetical protein [Herbaspirillum robiniae]
MTAMIQLTLDGSLVKEQHLVSLRVLSKSMAHLQSASDRAYLDVLHGNVWKHQKLLRRHYADADFQVDSIRQGSFVIEFVSTRGREIVRRLHQALVSPYAGATAGGDKEVFQISVQVARRKGQLDNELVAPQTYENLVENPDPLVTRKYGDRSINKEIDQLLVPVRADPAAVLKLALKSDEHAGTETYEFTQQVAKAFHREISVRELGTPVIYRGRLRSLDHGHNKNWNLKGKFINTVNNKDIVLNIQTEDDFNQLVPYLNQDPLTIIACPIIEYASFDPTAGDIQFIQIIR